MDVIWSKYRNCVQSTDMAYKVQIHILLTSFLIWKPGYECTSVNSNQQTYGNTIYNWELTEKHVWMDSAFNFFPHYHPYLPCVIFLHSIWFRSCVAFLMLSRYLYLSFDSYRMVNKYLSRCVSNTDNCKIMKMAFPNNQQPINRYKTGNNKGIL